MRTCVGARSQSRPVPTPVSGGGKIFIGRAEETEAHIVEALRLSPRDTMAYTWMMSAGIAKNSLRQLRASGPMVSTCDRDQPKLS